MKTYIYVGDGACIPGLPKVISQSEVDTYNGDQLALLQEAVAEGLYTVEGEEAPKPKPKSKRHEFVQVEDEAEKGA